MAAQAIPARPNPLFLLFSINAAHDIEQILAADTMNVDAKTFTSNSPKSPLNTQKIAINAVKIKNPTKILRNILLAGIEFILLSLNSINQQKPDSHSSALAATSLPTMLSRLIGGIAIP
jgi:hypothetical protein